jgi:PAS domain S-box-containing protein
MSETTRKPRRARSIRELAESKLAGGAAVDLEKLTPDEVRRFVHELEVHRIELEIQNQDLEEAQREAEASRERYRQLYESAPIGYLTLDPDGAIVTANLAATELLRLPRAQLLGRKLSSFVAAGHQDRWHFARRALADGGERRSLELALLLDDDSTLDVALTASGQPDAAGRVNLGVLDLTELRGVERALREAAAAASLVEQQERSKLAADLHDSVGQLLSLVSIKLRALDGSVAGDWSREFSELAELLAEARSRINSLSFQLSPPLLDDVGLVAATRWLAEDIERSFGLEVVVEESPELSLGEATRVTLFRAIRELLINVTKHAGVGTARVRLWREGVQMLVAVEDSGFGFGRDAGQNTFGRQASRAGFGLLALRERLLRLGGTLAIGPGPDGVGSRVVVSVPCADGEGAPS